jgi:multidrug efflux pump subunit AcrB
MSDPIEEKHKFIAWFAHNSVVANVLLFAILGFGIWTAITVRKEAFPSFAAKSVSI